MNNDAKSQPTSTPVKRKVGRPAKHFESKEARTMYFKEKSRQSSRRWQAKQRVIRNAEKARQRKKYDLINEITEALRLIEFDDIRKVDELIRINNLRPEP